MMSNIFSVMLCMSVTTSTLFILISFHAVKTCMSQKSFTVFYRVEKTIINKTKKQIVIIIYWQFA